MTDKSGANDVPRALDDEERTPGNDWLSDLGEQERREALNWVGDNLPEVRRSAYGQRSLYWALGVGFVVGLAVYAAGYALRSSVTTEPLGFVADFLYTFGWALWTGVVVAFFLQVIPQAKKRGYQQLLDVYEAAVREKARGEGEQVSGNDGATD
ncbi:MAG TPA: hypothetical protein VHN56_01810 [Actinomycetota bacterium]|jgi:hypothetical protein|nr:hypothetical protein [Actinomycetota bacterium]